MPLIGGVGRSGTSTPLPTGVNYSAIRATDVGDFQGTYTPVWGDPGRSRTVNPGNPPISQLVDDFSTQDTSKWTFNAAAAVTGGQLELTPNASYTGQIISVGTYTLNGSYAAVQLVQPLNVGNGTTEVFYSVREAANPGSQLITWYINNGQLIARKTVGGGTTVLFTTAFSATTHKWLRISASAGIASWDTSTDGQSWTSQFSVASPINLDAVALAVTVGFGGTEPSPGLAIFDNVNTSPTSVAASATGTITLDGTGGTPSAQPTSVGSILLSGSGGTPSAAATATGAVTLGGSGTAQVPASASGGITLAGAGTASARPTAAGSITLAGTGTAGVSATAAGAITLGGTATAGATAAATGSVTLGGSPAAAGQAAATGGITLGGTSTAAAAATTTGSVTLSGTGTGTQPGANTAAGSVTLAGTATARAAAATSGTITLTGQGTAAVTASSGGAITLAGAAQLSALANATGSIQLAGLATGTGVGGLRDITLTVGALTTRTLTGSLTTRTIKATVAVRSTTATATARSTTTVLSTRTLSATVEV